MVYLCVCGCSRLCLPPVATGDGVEDLIAMPHTRTYMLRVFCTTSGRISGCFMRDRRLIDDQR